MIKIINQPFSLKLYGFSGAALNKDYTGTAFRLSARMWETVKANNLKNKGMNVRVYEPGEMVFTGLELEDKPDAVSGLEQKTITLTKYAYFKHIGPYKLIKQVGLNMQDEIKKNGFETLLPYIEIYGHWTGDETKSETELFMALK
jgi:predicted transcriptional regulator YdeE